MASQIADPHLFHGSNERLFALLWYQHILRGSTGLPKSFIVHCLAKAKGAAYLASVREAAPQDPPRGKFQIEFGVDDSGVLSAELREGQMLGQK